MQRTLGRLPVQWGAVLAAPLLLLLLLIAFGSVTLHRLATRDLVAEQNVQTVRSVAASISERLVQLSAILHSLDAESVAADSWPNTTFDGGVAVYDEQANLIAVSPWAQVWADDPQIIEAVLNAGQQTDYLPLVEFGQNHTQVAVIIRQDDQRLVGVSSLRALGVDTLVNGLHTSPGARIIIATPDGMVLFHSDPSLVGGPLVYQTHTLSALNGESGANYFHESSGEEAIAAFAPIPASGWRVIHEELWTALLSPLMRYSQAVAVSLLPGLALAVLALWLVVGGVVNPLRRLEARAAALATDDFDSIEESVGGTEEIKSLQATLQDLAHQVAAAQQMSRYTIATITQAQEDERRRLARELHDHMIQALIALDHRMQMLGRHFKDDPALLERLRELRDMNSEAIEDLRRMIRAMRPIYLEDFGLAPALEALGRDLSERTGIIVAVEKRGEPRRLPPETEISLYRVAQESLNNISRHSEATRVWLSVCFEPERVWISVRDDGVGFDAPQRPTDLAHNGHFGLIGMHERASLISGKLTIDSIPETGTTVTIEAPIDEEEKPTAAASAE